LQELVKNEKIAPFARFIAGLLAQPPLQTDASTTLRYAVWQHGAAADVLQSRHLNWVVEELLGELGNGRPVAAGQT
jgi:hypothetical protein